MATLPWIVFLLLWQASVPAPHSQPEPKPLDATPATHVSPAQQSKAANQAQQAAGTEQSGAAPQRKPVVLDSVVAIINGDVLLESDVEQERRSESLEGVPPSQNTDARAAEHLITRTLILQQMKEQDLSPAAASDAALDKSIAALKKELPGCAGRCGTEAGWAAFLGERELTPAAVRARQQQRVVITGFLDQRFREGLRAPEADVQAYYDKTLAPQFRAKHQQPPSLKALRPRIEEILLAEQETKQIDDWEATLRQEGSVQILVPAYGQSNKNAEDAADIPGGAL